MVLDESVVVEEESAGAGEAVTPGRPGLANGLVPGETPVEPSVD
jgi:hypothetical protein